MKMAFRLEASPRIGGGHLIRCLALADSLASPEVTCVFFVSQETLEAAPSFANTGSHFILVDGAAPCFPAALERLWSDGADGVVIDHYGYGADLERALRPLTRTVMVIDDLADRPHDCDVLVDQTAGRAASEYTGLVPTHCRLLTGAQYALLRPQFRERRDEALRLRSQQRPVQRLLMSFGMTDPCGLSERLLEVLISRDPGLSFDVVCGLDQSEPLMDIASRSRQVTLHYAVADMASLMVAADLAVGAAGLSSWERCTLGLPTAVVVAAENQRRNAESLTAGGAALFLGDAETLDVKAAADAILELVHAPTRLHSISRAAFGLCDGEGVWRVRAELTRSMERA